MLNESEIPVLKKVIVASGNTVAIGDTLEAALVNLFSDANSVDLEFINTDNIEALIDSVIRANQNLNESLNDKEKDIARRARNTKMNTVSKNASLADYKKATSFEAVIGYNYLLGNFDRLEQFFGLISSNFLKETK